MLSRIKNAYRVLLAEQIASKNAIENTRSDIISHIDDNIATEKQSLQIINDNVKEILRLMSTPSRDGQSTALYNRMGFRLLLDSTSLVDGHIIDHDAWEQDQINYLFKEARHVAKTRDIVFLDIGSYWGLYSLIAFRNGISHIHAFEADKHNFAQLQAQIFLNDGAGAISAHNLAVDNARKTVLYLDSRGHPEGNRGGVGVIEDASRGRSYEMQADSIDSYLGLNDQCIFIKLDIEGHERSALEGMRNTILNNYVFMQIEIFDEFESKTLPALEGLNLRLLKTIGPDRYYTNMPDNFFDN